MQPANIDKRIDPQDMEIGKIYYYYKPEDNTFVKVRLESRDFHETGAPFALLEVTYLPEEKKGYIGFRSDIYQQEQVSKFFTIKQMGGKRRRRTKRHRR